MFRYKRKISPLKKIIARRRVTISGFQIPGQQRSLYRMSLHQFPRPLTYSVRHVNLKRRRLRLHRWIPTYFRLAYHLKRYGVDIPYPVRCRGAAIESLQARAKPDGVPLTMPTTDIRVHEHGCAFPHIPFDGFPVRLYDLQPRISFSLSKTDVQITVTHSIADSQESNFAPFESPQLVEHENFSFEPLESISPPSRVHLPDLPKLRILVSGDLEHFGPRKTVEIHALDVEALMIYSLAAGSRVKQKSVPAV